MSRDVNFVASLFLAAAMALAFQANSLAQVEPPQAAPAQRLNQTGRIYGRATLTYTDAQGHSVHVFPTVPMANAMRASGAATTPLVYHSGGLIMPRIEIYNIFWVPPKLQNGKQTSMPSYYPGAMNNLAIDYAGHTLDSNATQYWQNISGILYVQGLSYRANTDGSWGGSFTDTSPYPPSDCSDSLTPGNCITDVDIQKEIQKVIAAQKWSGGLNKIFNVYTAKGEGSCADIGCAYSDYCAYHGSIGIGSSSIIYSNEPYAASPYCQAGGVPNHADSDAAASVTSHEITEAITDPNLDAWFTAAGSEIGDLCAWDYGTNTYDKVGGVYQANQRWNGRYYEIQMMWDNHQNKCVQAGP